MSTNFITPIQRYNSSYQAEQIKSQVVEGEAGSSTFRGIFKDAIQNVKDTSKEYEYQQYLLATGQTDDVHNVPIAAAKAQLSVDLLVQLRTKALESYNELMRMSI